MPRALLPLPLLLVALLAPAQDPPAVPPLLAARSGPGRAKVLEVFGANAASEAAVAKALAWLARQQKPGWYWEFDPREPKLKQKDWATATGLALLPFLGAGQTHRDGSKYKKTVADGLTWLRNDLNLATGKFAHDSRVGYMYGHGIATLALCEGYALTGDPVLKAPAQAAVNHIVKGQGADGSWGYQAGTNGDTSITGWQLQALFAARLGKLNVPDATLRNAVRFLDGVASGPTKSVYGYRQPGGAPGTALSAIGLWSRHNFDGWTPDHPGMKAGAAGLAAPARRPKTAAQAKAAPATPDLYFYYYATLTMFAAGGDGWRDWFLGPEADGARAGGMRDWLVAVQTTDGNDAGSWPADPAFIGAHCGRLGSTALAALILETPYRYLPIDRDRRP